MQRHAPVKPLWFCAACANPWPCGPARLELAAQYAGEPKWLAVDMAELLHEAIADLTRLNAEPPDGVAMYGRFLGWVRHLAVSRARNAGHFRSGSRSPRRARESSTDS
ncbi:flavin reductase [Micromonospora sp. NPDC018662]|uniref:flavin reductase n=1 Tax=Micromonospora sp. NPDC018662 TaxID=3364238 RepID=UPI00378F6D75